MMPESASREGMLHHVEIYVSELEVSVKFWGWLLGALGYEEFQKWEQGRSWKLGETYIVFVQTVEKHRDVKYHRCRTGLNHLAFHVGSMERLRELEAELRGRGVPMLYEDREKVSSGNPRLFFEDPDRIKVELVGPGEWE